MEEQYLANEEYEHYYEKLNGLRTRIINDIPIEPNMFILDIGTGYAYFAIEAAKHDASIKIAGIDISREGVYKAQKNIREFGFFDRIAIIAVDATRMSFNGSTFDMAMNFTGLEDIYMTRGRKGIQKTFCEVDRILKSKAPFCFVVLPVDEMETAAQKIEVALYSFICNATWLKRKEYIHMLENAELTLVQEKSYTTGKKLTPEQARCEIRFACENAPKIYGVKTRSFQEVWSKFGKEIELNGCGHLAKVKLMIAHKKA